MAFRNEGDVILLLDGASSATSYRHSERSEESLLACEFSSSEYSKAIAGIVAGEPPAIDLAAEKRLIDCLVALAGNAGENPQGSQTRPALQGAVQSAHDLSDGGLAVAIAESCFASKGLGAQVKIEGEANAEHALFGERGARAIVSIAPGKVGAVLASARQYGVGAREIGKVTRDYNLRIEYKGHAVIAAPIPTLQDTWAHSLERNLRVQ